MGRRPKVPAALHSELSEYASLLRALRTSDTLDLASQLAATASAPATAPASVHDGVRISDDEGESERPATESVADLRELDERSIDDDDVSARRPKRKAKHKAKAKAKAPKASRDNWTRWPLLAGDVYVPEWSLEDEVRLLATQALKAQLREDEEPSLPTNEPADPAIDTSTTDAPPAGDIGPVAASESGTANPAAEESLVDDSDDDEAVEELLPPHVLSSLTASSGRFLSQVLALLAAYVPPSEKSMQNRVHPITWESIVDIVAVNGLVDEKIVGNVRQRLSAIYPAVSTRPEHLFLNFPRQPDDLSYLDIDGYKPVSEAMKRKRGPYRKRDDVEPRQSKRLKAESISPEV